LQKLEAERIAAQPPIVEENLLPTLVRQQKQIEQLQEEVCVLFFC
jgi:hypothetical protein